MCLYQREGTPLATRCRLRACLHLWYRGRTPLRRRRHRHTNGGPCAAATPSACIAGIGVHQSAEAPIDGAKLFGTPTRSSQQRVYAGEACCGKTAVDWFQGSNLHLAGDDRCERLACCLPPGIGDARRLVPRLVRRLFGHLLEDRSRGSESLAELRFLV